MLVRKHCYLTVSWVSLSQQPSTETTRPWGADRYFLGQFEVFFAFSQPLSPSTQIVTRVMSCSDPKFGHFRCPDWLISSDLKAQEAALKTKLIAHNYLSLASPLGIIVKGKCAFLGKVFTILYKQIFFKKDRNQIYKKEINKLTTLIRINKHYSKLLEWNKSKTYRKCEFQGSSSQ